MMYLHATYGKKIIFAIILIFSGLCVNLLAQTLDPPTNLTAQSTDDGILLNWENPTVSPYNQPTLSWNVSDVDTVGNSVPKQYPIFAGCRFYNTDLNFQQHIGRKVKSVNLYAENEDGLSSFKLQVFRSHTPSSYDIVKVYEQPFETAPIGEHTIVELENDLYITPNFRFYTFGYELNYPDTLQSVRTFGMDCGPAVDRRGDWVHTPSNGGWQMLHNVGFFFGLDVDANFIIKVTLSEKYNVYRDGELIATVYEPTFFDNTVGLGETHCYSIKTVFLDSLSIATESVCCTSEGNIPAPDNFTITASNCRPTLEWNSVENMEHDGDFLHYRIYKNNTYLTSTLNTQFTDEMATIGEITYCLSAVYFYNGIFLESELTCLTTTLQPPSINIIGNLNICENESTTLTATGTANSYLWNSGETTASINVTPSETTIYTVVATSAVGCSSTTETTVQVFPLPNATITPDITICQGETTILTAGGGSSYLWNTGDTTASISITPSETTTYSVTVFNEQQCSVEQSCTVNVINLPQPITAYVADTAICFGESLAIAVETSDDILWSHNGSNEHEITLQPSASTTYIATMTNNFGCSVVDSFHVDVRPLPIITITGETDICELESTMLTAQGASSWIWNDGSTQDNITVSPLQNTDYQVIGTNIYGCSGSQTVSVMVRPLPIAHQEILGNSYICRGSYQSFSTTIQYAESYSWSVPQGVQIVEGAGESTITALVTDSAQSGMVTVFGSNACGLSEVQSLSLSINSCNIIISGNFQVCEQSLQTYVCDQENQPCTWEISGGTIVSGNGTHEIIVAWGNAGTGTLMVHSEWFSSPIHDININALPTVSIEGATTVCLGESIVLTAVSDLAGSFLWSNGETTPSITVSPSEETTYNVSVTTAEGCSSSAAFSVSLLAKPEVTIEGATTMCPGDSVVLTAVSDVAGEMLWSNGETTPSITISPTENSSYSVSVTTADGCSSSAEVSVIIHPLPEVTIQGVSEICSGESIVLTAVSNVAGEILWSNGETTPNITISPTENSSYSVSVTTPEGCSSSSEISISLQPLPEVTIEGVTEICWGESIDLTAESDLEGEMLWSNGETAPNITVSPTETSTYSVSVTTADGCSGSAEVSVIVHPLPEVTIEGVTEICLGESIDLTAESDVAGEILWSNGETTANITVSPTENCTYSVSVTTAEGCSGSAEVSVIVHPLPEVTIQGVTEICLGEMAIFTVMSNLPGTILWSNGETTPSITVSPTENSTYSVSVTTADGCSGSAEVSIIVLPSPEVTIEGATEVCLGESIVLTATSSLEGEFLWSNGETTASITVSPSEETTYSVGVTTADGCSSNAEISITVLPLPVLSIAGATEMCLGESIHLTAVSYLANEFLWSNGETTQTITISPTENGTYSVIATTADGCNSSAEVNVIVHPLPNVSIEGVTEICLGESVNLTAVSDLEGEFLWNNGETTPNIIVSPTENSTYSVSVTTAESCSGSAEVSVIVHPLPEVTIQGATEICLSESIDLTAVSDLEGEMLWSNGETTASITVSPSEETTYSVSVTTADGCSNTASITVSVEYVTMPSDFLVTPLNISIQLEWTEVPNARKYRIFRDNELIDSTLAISYLDINVTPNTTYCYQLQAVSPLCVSELTEPLCCEIVAISELSSRFTLYPNPASDYLTVSGNPMVGISIVNLLGQVILEERFSERSEVRLSTERLTCGVYLVRIQQVDGNIVVKKVVIER